MTKCHLPSGSWSPSGCVDARTRMRTVSCSRTCAPSVMWLCPGPCGQLSDLPNTPARSSRTWRARAARHEPRVCALRGKMSRIQETTGALDPKQEAVVSTYSAPGVSFLSKKWCSVRFLNVSCVIAIDCTCGVWVTRPDVLPLGYIILTALEELCNNTNTCLLLRALVSSPARTTGGLVF